MTLSSLVSWYTSTSAEGTTLLIGFSAVAATVWAGCLIAFTLNRRYTHRLRYGLDYIAQCFYVPLALLALPHLFFQIGATLAAIAFSAFAILLLLLRYRFRVLKKYKLTFQWKLGDDETKPTPEVFEKIERTMQLYEDNFYGLIYGGPYLSVTAIAYIIMALYPLQRVALSVYIIVLYLGFSFCYEQIAPRLELDRKPTPLSETLQNIWKLVQWWKPLSPPSTAQVNVTPAQTDEAPTHGGLPVEGLKQDTHPRNTEHNLE